MKEPRGLRVQVSDKKFVYTWKYIMSFPSLGIVAEAQLRQDCRLRLSPAVGGLAFTSRIASMFQHPTMLIRDWEKGRPLNYLYDSVCEAKVLAAFHGAVLYCIGGKSHFSTACFGISVEVTLPSQWLQTSLYGSQTLPSSAIL